MYGLPHTFDASVFVEKTLQRIEFTVNTVKLALDDDTSIVVESQLCHQWKNPHSRWEDRTTIPATESRLMRLLDKHVVGGSVEGQGTLVLQFSNGDILRVVEDSEQYECYQLRIGSTEIIV